MAAEKKYIQYSACKFRGMPVIASSSSNSTRGGYFFSNGGYKNHYTSSNIQCSNHLTNILFRAPPEKPHANNNNTHNMFVDRGRDGGGIRREE